MELRWRLVASRNLHDQLRPAQRLSAAVATPAASRPTGDDRILVVGETALGQPAADQKLRAARLEPLTDFLLKPDAFSQELVGRDNEPLGLSADPFSSR
jgi:hypothetical protein